ncbi:tripartite tricarboxylate transporter substrate binding protein [Variovorax sp. J22P168]|uniref:Bug family tripartite tricarboxylate transporter substrate binding protein n=1 Tax=Variovorax jilinensis TaxID=3053513 RepID=UPI002577BCC6|nr:tripartite tricarboxylate transporter substrate binding protein [Variovorax sp. J22P168]MDM0015084.1 tripartite tricarboxylate transporter substrate binding protein [Variovorax sp. J22P168]
MSLPPFVRAFVAATLAITGAAAAAQPAYPERAVTLVSPFPAGGATDLVARVIAQRLAVAMDQPFVVDNRAGATGLIGEAYVMRARADGYTVLIASNSSHVIAPLLQAKKPFDPVSDFEPITMLGSYPLALKVNPAVSAKDVKELVALAKKSPGKLNFGSIGTGSVTHLAGEQFKLKSGIDMTHVPYKGTAALATALIAGEIDLQFDSVGSTKPLVDAGRARALAVTGSKRSALLPQVPTLAEAGVPGVDAIVWVGAFAPKGTPPAIVARLQQEMVKALNEDAGVRRVFSDNGMDIVGNDSRAFGQSLQSEQKSWADMISAAGIEKQ